MIYNIQDVQQFENPIWYGFRFRMNHSFYRLQVNKPVKKIPIYRVQKVRHDSLDICPFCKKIAYMEPCEALIPHVESVFNELISPNHLRLEWVFRAYTFNK